MKGDREGLVLNVEFPEGFMNIAKFKKEDYVMCLYDGELLSAKILEVLPGAYRVEMYIDTLDNGERLMQEMVVTESQLRPVTVALVSARSDKTAFA